MIEDIKLLIENGENQFVEFKSSFGQTAINAIVAFANSDGGKVLIGIEENPVNIKGVSISSETIQEWTNQVKQATSPAIIPDFYVYEIENKTIVMIEVHEYPVKPVSTKGKYLKRNNNSNHQMDLIEISNLYLKTFNLSWDAYEYPNATLNDLDPKKIDRFIEKVNENDRFSLDKSPLLALEKLRLIKNNNPTGAALLLFAKNPLPFSVHIGRLKTSSMIIDEKLIKGTLYEVVQETMKFIISHIKVAFEFDGSIERKEILEYPLPALREAVLNAIVHRDYTDPSDIQIKIFDKSISIFNPGKLYGNLTIKELENQSYNSSIRNLLVTEAFYLTKDIEKYGTGFIRINDQIEKYNTMKFLFEEKSNGFLATFKYDEQKQFNELTPKTNNELTPKIDKELTPKTVNKGISQKQIFNLIKKDCNISKEEIAIKLNVSINSIKYHLKNLKSKNIVEWVGVPRKGKWKILQNQENAGLNQETAGINQEGGGLNQEDGGLNQGDGGVNQESGGLNQESGGLNQESGGLNLLRIIRTKPGKRTNELSLIIDKPNKTIEKWLKKLKDKNKIEFKGSKKTGGYYAK